MSALALVALIIFAALGVPRQARAQSAAAVSRYDYLFPGHTAFSLGMATGIPFLAMSEAGVGVGKHFAVGVLAGITPTVVGVGLRPRAALDLPRQHRLLLLVPALYYPKTNQVGGIPWGLMRPTLLLERAHERWRFNAGGGAFLAAPMDTVLGRNPERLASAYGASAHAFRGGVWGTLTTAAAWAIGEHTSVFGEAGVVLGPRGLAGKDWIGGPPFTLSLGVSTRL
ncbi:MAG: hypothetical protein JWN04_5640 [Myxococcaceae bacterium]|nr:hypothetical protein [Myxococcaceae bacterium]